MSSSNNNVSHQAASSKKSPINGSSQPSDGKSNKIKILSQTLLKAANLTTRKDFLTNVLERPENKLSKTAKKQLAANDGPAKTKERKLFIESHTKSKEKITSKRPQDSDTRDNVSTKKNDIGYSPLDLLDSNSGQAQFIKYLNKIKSKKREMLSDSDEENKLNNLSVRDKFPHATKEISDLDTSEEFEKSIRKTQISKLDGSINTKQNETVDASSKLKGKKLEVISDSSDSEEDKNVKKESRSSSSGSESDSGDSIKNRTKQVNRSKRQSSGSSSNSDSSESKNRETVVSRSKKRSNRSSSDSDSSDSKNKGKGGGRSKGQSNRSASDSESSESKKGAKEVTRSRGRSNRTSSDNDGGSSKNGQKRVSRSKRQSNRSSSDSESSESKKGAKEVSRSKRQSNRSSSDSDGGNSKNGQKRVSRSKRQSNRSSSDSDSSESKKGAKEVTRSRGQSKRSSSDSDGSNSKNGQKRVSRSKRQSNRSSSDSDSSQSKKRAKRVSRARGQSNRSSSDSDGGNSKNGQKRVVTSKRQSNRSSSDSDSSDSKNAKRPKGVTRSKRQSSRSSSESDSVKNGTKRANVSKGQSNRSSSSDSDTDTNKKSRNKRKNSSSSSSQSSSEDSRSESSHSESNKRRIKKPAVKKNRRVTKSGSDTSGGENKKGASSSGCNSSSSDDEKTNQSRSKRDSSNSDSDAQKSAKKPQASSSKLKRKYHEINGSDDSSNEANKRRKVVSPVKTEADKLLENFSVQGEFKPVEAKAHSRLSALKKNEEVYLVQISKNVDPRLLLGKAISFDGPTSFKIENKDYMWDVSHSAHNDINLLDFDNLIHLQPRGLITVQPRLKAENTEFEIRPVDDVVNLPSNLKVRHPLFGTKYEERIKLDPDILRKLDEIVVDVDRKSKKKSRRKRRDTVKEQECVEDEKKVEEKDDALDIIKLLNEHESQFGKSERKDKKKKKKSKHTEEHKAIVDEVENEAESILSQIFSDMGSPKRKKKDRPKIDSYDASSPYEHSLCTKKKKHKHSFDLSRDIIQSSPVLPQGKRDKEEKTNRKEKRKLTSIPMNDEEEDGMDNNLFINGDVRVETLASKHKKHKKEKKHKSRSFDLDEMDVAPTVTSELVALKKEGKHKLKYVSELNTAISDQKDAKRKNKHPIAVVNSTMTSSPMGNAILHLDESCIPKSKKKHKHRNSLDNFIYDIVKGDESVPPKRKKSKKDKKKGFIC